MPANRLSAEEDFASRSAWKHASLASYIYCVEKITKEKACINRKLAEKKGEGREALWNTYRGAVEKEKQVFSVQL